MTTTINWLSRRVWLLNGAWWLAYWALQLASMAGMLPSGVHLFEMGLSSLHMMLPCVILGPVVMQMSARLTMRPSVARRSWSRLLMVVVGAAAIHGLVIKSVSMLVRHLWTPWAQMLALLPFHSLQYAALAGIAVAVTHRQLLAARERDFVAAQLRALRAQLQPHFLFNTLQGVAAAASTDSALATRMIALLGDLLRQTLRERDGGLGGLVALDEERRMLEPYLELQKLRLGVRLRIEIDVAADVATAAVPDLLLQPLVENAVEHGVEPRPEGGVVRIVARRVGEALQIQVQDDGNGIATNGEPGRGIGLAATRERLQTLFGNAASVSLQSLPAGAVATVMLPFREVARAA